MCYIHELKSKRTDTDWEDVMCWARICVLAFSERMSSGTNDQGVAEYVVRIAFEQHQLCKTIDCISHRRREKSIVKEMSRHHGSAMKE